MPDVDLERFVAAQEPVYGRVLDELRRGEKRSHWMWFVFPQIAGLGRSPTAQHFAISGMAEAQAYLAHDVLGARLVETTQIVNTQTQRSAETIFGGIDAMKFRSSMTLFEAAGEGLAEFGLALDQFYGGERDHSTLRLLGVHDSSL